MVADGTGGEYSIYTRGHGLIKSDEGYYLHNGHGDVVQIVNNTGSIESTLGAWIAIFSMIQMLIRMI